ncbi:hypothetical protein GCM10023083_82530 [Streptomyces phyllanthi]
MRKEKDTDGIEKPMRRTRWSVPPSEEYERVHPPVLLVRVPVGGRQRSGLLADVGTPAVRGREAVTSSAVARAASGSVTGHRLSAWARVRRPRVIRRASSVRWPVCP